MHIQIIFGMVVKASPGCIIFFRDDIVIRGWCFPFEESCRTTNAAGENVGRMLVNILTDEDIKRTYKSSSE